MNVMSACGAHGTATGGVNLEECMHHYTHIVLAAILKHPGSTLMQQPCRYVL